MKFGSAAGVFVLAALAACGGGSPPTTPTPPPNRVTSYAGSWAGTYRVTACTASGFFADAAFCSSVLNTTASVTFTFAQTDRAVTGAFTLGSIGFPAVAATIAADDSLSVSSSLTTGLFPIDASWTLRQPSSTALAGQTHQVWKAAGQSGDARLDGEIVSVAKTSAASAGR